MEQRVSLITLGVKDLGVARRFYEHLGWNGQEVEEVDDVMRRVAAAGATVTRDPAATFYGGYAGCFRDPDGHVWEVAFNPGFALDDDGNLTVPVFDDAEPPVVS